MSAPNISLLKSQTKIDILIPAIEKDLEVLPFAIDSVIKNVNHPIGDIIIVAPNCKKIKSLCIQKKCKFIDENTVLSITKKDINYQTNKWDRSGWLFQQLLKLGGDSLCTQEHFLVMDADTLLILPHIFHIQNKTFFYCRDWSHNQYFKTYKKLLGVKPSSPLSFVSHYMLFEKSILTKMKRTIESNHKTSWYSAIIQSINTRKKYTFSEFETYGNFFYSNYPTQVILEKSLNKGFKRENIEFYNLHKEKLSTNYRSISYHNRKGYQIN